MERNDKFFYEAPLFQVIEIQIDVLICQSQNTMDNRNNYGSTEDNPFEG